MKHPLTIAGRLVELEWNNETSRRFAYRLQTIGGHPPPAQFRNPRTSPAAYFKILWALLPKDLLTTYPDPEDLAAAVDHETEAAGIYEALAAIYADMNPDPEKKSTSMKSPLPESNSA